METLINFFLKTSAGLAQFYIVYWLFLSKETFHKANRLFLIIALLISIMLPLFPIHYVVMVEPERATTAFHGLNEIIGNVRPSATISTLETIEFFTWEKIILVVYLMGVTFFLFRLFSQTFTLVCILLKSKIKSEQGIKIIENDRYELPFSFFNVVFINPKFHTQEDLPEILAHEKVHIRENHWFDLLFIELLTVIFWFNPFIWFFERSIKQNHEYLADQGVLSLGEKVGRYQALLVNQLMGMQVIGITNNLNFSLNTNRLKMMTKMKSPKIRRLKFIWALLAFALLILACAERSYEVKQDEIEETNNIVGLDVISQNQHIIQGKIINDETQQPLHGATVVIRGTTIGTVADEQGNFTLTDPNPKFDEDTKTLNSEIVVSFVGFQSEVEKVNIAEKNGDGNDFTCNMKRALIAIDMNVTDDPVPPPPPPVTKSRASNQKNSSEEIFFVVEEMPQFPGGVRSLQKYVKNSIKYPKVALDKGISGTVQIKFRVNEDGIVKDVGILKSVAPSLDEEALRVVNILPMWKPGKQRGKPVPVDFVIPIEFSN